MKAFINYYIKNNIYLVGLYNLLLVMVLFMLSRFAFYFVNIDYFEGMSLEQFITICSGGIKFDTTAVLYINLIYLLMMILPFKFRANRTYLNSAKWIFLVTNSAGIITNCIDIVYFRFTTRRTTSTVFSEFSNEDNMWKVMGESAIEYWYVVLIAVVLIFLLVKLFYNPSYIKTYQEKKPIYYTRNIIAMCLAIMFTIFGLRGGIGDFVRPITLSNANKYVDKTLEANIVLNTPFCLIRTIGKKVFKNPKYFKDEQEMKSYFNPIITPHPKEEFKNLNVVVFIMESFSKEFVGYLNQDLDDGKYEGYTPFLDSLIQQSLSYEYTYSNGRKSIDAMPSILSSIPRFYEPYFLTRYSNNRVGGMANELNKKGYYTAFFHGAPNGSMGFQAFAKVSGFKDYYGKDEYGNDDDYDGTWSIWDEEFFQFYAKKMGEFKQPFMTTLFSASSHHPFKVPEKYKDIFVEEGGHPLHKCVRYSDYSLKRFFETASKQDWYKNTLFVITADHTNALTRKEYLNDAGVYKVPIIFFRPDSNLKGFEKKIAQQIDIMPTVLGYLNYDKPYVAFGKDLLDSTYIEHTAINFNNEMFQYFKGDKMYQFDGQNMHAVYDMNNDPLLSSNILDKTETELEENQIKSIVQQYIERMTTNNLKLEGK